MQRGFENGPNKFNVKDVGTGRRLANTMTIGLAIHHLSLSLAWNCFKRFLIFVIDPPSPWGSRGKGPDCHFPKEILWVPISCSQK